MKLFAAPTWLITRCGRQGWRLFRKLAFRRKEDIGRSWYLYPAVHYSGLPELSRPARQVYSHLASSASGDGFCEPSTSELANECLISVSTATRALKELERVRLVVSVLRLGRIGRPHRAYYVVRPNRAR